jgi:glycosyltransferase involved in cell wall biosynthesis
VAVLQDGARLHYAVPLALQKAGLLERVFADWYDAPGAVERAASSAISRLSPARSRKMAARYCAELDGSRVLHNPALALRIEFGRRFHRSAQEYWEWVCRELARWVMNTGTGRANAFFGFIRNMHPDLAAWCRGRGLCVLGDQMIAPAAAEYREAMSQLERFADWHAGSHPRELLRQDRFERRTWENVNHITCASEYVRGCLIEQGVEASRVTMLPYPLEAAHYPFIDRAGRGGPVTVGFVGGVNLRKGAPYFLEVAKRLASDQLRFVMVGPVQLAPAALEAHRDGVEITGPVPRSQVGFWLERFDIFLFPSTCEGSATAIMEAMASGLPVVCSPNAGSVARNEQEGFIMPYDDIDRMADAVARLAADTGLRSRMGRAARERVESFNLDWYSRRMAELLNGLIGGRASGA